MNLLRKQGQIGGVGLRAMSDRPSPAALRDARLIVAPRSGRIIRRAVIPALLASTCLGSAALAQDATWTGAQDFRWETSLNWAPPTVPGGTATFGPSANHNITFGEAGGGGASVQTLVFTAAAPQYSFNVDSSFNGSFQLRPTTVFITGTGIINNSAFAPQFFVTSALGTLEFFNAAGAGNATISTSAGITLFTDHSSAASAVITSNSGGETAFQSNSTAGNATIRTDDGGKTVFSNFSTAGNAVIITNSGGVTSFADASTGGLAQLVTNAGGVLDMASLQTSGLRVGSIEGAGNYGLGSKSLTVGGNNLSTEVSGVISGTGGSLVKEGTGTLTLSGTNTYTGATAVNAGTLLVNGSIASSSLTTVNSGGTLAGTGTVGALTVASGGTFAPGPVGAVGSMTVAGNLAFQSGAIYLVQVTPATASSAAVVANGKATLAGTVNAQFAAGSYVAKSYTILSASNGVSGTFDSLATTNLPQGFKASLLATANAVTLDLTAGMGQPGQGGLPNAGLGGNQQRVANAINAFFNNGGALPPGFVNLFGLSGANLNNALSLLSGEAATGAQTSTFLLMSEFLNVMTDPFIDGREGIGGGGGGTMAFAPEQKDAPPSEAALAYASVLKAPLYKAAPWVPRWSAWGTAFGGYNHLDGDAAAGTNDLTVRTGGFAAGLDYRWRPDTTVGFALAGGATNWGLANGVGGGRSDAFQAGVYGTTRAGPAYLSAALAYGAFAASTDRAAFGIDHLSARFDPQSFGGRLEGGYRYALGAFGVTPYAAVQAVAVHVPAYSETDTAVGGFGLTFDSRNASDTRGELGARFDHFTVLDNGMGLMLRGRAAYAHDWVSDPSVLALFQALPGAAFTVIGATPVKDSALLSAAAELHVTRSVSVGARFDSQLAEHGQSYAGTGTVRVAW